MKAYATLFLALLVLAGCKSNEGFDAEVVLPLIDDTTAKVLQKREASVGAPPTIAFVGIQNESNWPLGSIEQFTFNHAGSEIVNSGKFNVVDTTAVKAGLQAASITSPEQLFLEKDRKVFLDEVGKVATYPEYLMWGTFTSLDDMRRDKETQSVYQLTMKISDSRTWQVQLQESSTFTR